ncbi:hypothetical protein A2U01_0100713, partial [Trifolium medium]|nr:hypothetical protein [Trifolium medium]
MQDKSDHKRCNNGKNGELYMCSDMQNSSSNKSHQ